MSEVKLEDIVSLCKRRGFIYQGSEIYGGLSGTWDYGPLGVTLKRNITNLWWRMFVEDRDDMYGVDAAILMNPKVWEASGHVVGFSDPLVTCLNCNSRFRVDQLVKEKDYKKYLDQTLRPFIQDQLNNYADNKAVIEELQAQDKSLSEEVEKDLAELEKLKKSNAERKVYREWLEKVSEKLNKTIESKKNLSGKLDYIIVFVSLLKSLKKSEEEARKYVGQFAKTYLDANIKCPICKGHRWSNPSNFEMMFKTNIGPVESDESLSYLRPETAQGIFTNFRNVVDSFYPDLPFGIAQQGKAFRNEISPRDFIFRAREFEQMEIEYFVHPDTWKKSFETWIKNVYEFLEAIGIPKSKIHELDVPEGDRAHYSKRTVDFEFDYPIGRKELLGLAYRTDFDLKAHQEKSGKDMEYRLKEGGEAFIPHVIEPSFGVERAVMAVLTNAYIEDEVGGEKRVYLKLPTGIAPVKVAVAPLLKNKLELVKKAREVYDMLKKEFGNVMWDDNGNIGKRYRRQDEIGTPHFVVVDFDTLEDDTVTIRDRDTTKQERVKVDELISKLI